MLEFIRHLFGSCGESHMNLTNILFGIIYDSTYINFLMSKIKYALSINKNI